MTAFRVVRRESFDPLVSLADGRYHKVGGPDTSYVALTARTAVIEVSAFLGRTLNPEAFELHQVEIDGQFADEYSHREIAGISGVPAPRAAVALADRLRPGGLYAGLMYPSARDSGGTCIVLFLEHDGVVQSVHPVDDDELVKITEKLRAEGGR